MKKPDNAPTDRHDLPFGALLKCWREEPKRNWQVKRAALEFGVKPATWSRWEAGLRFPAPHQVRPLADFMGVPVCRFFCGPDWRCPCCVRRGE
ncbi:MAG: helix-turn-helix transcriptional regulator [Verrucomicrobia bacterium]|nr:helix-turn-helix transcriptional regulator [Verrucomicrobiota bacterium]